MNDHQRKEWRELSGQVALAPVAPILGNAIEVRNPEYLQEQAKRIGYKAAWIAGGILEGIKQADSESVNEQPEL